MATVLRFLLRVDGDPLLRLRRPSPDTAPASGGKARVIKFPRASAPAPAPKPGRRARGNTQADDQRKAMLAKVHIAKKDLTLALPRFNGDTYRFILESSFGVSSAADLSLEQLHALLLHFKNLGFQAQKRGKRKDTPAALCRPENPLQPRMGKIEALLAEKGRVEGTDMPWGYAVGILKRQTKGEIKSFSSPLLTPADLDGVIAALCRDAARKGRHYEVYGRGVAARKR
jgi:hypothetical protein